MTVRTLLATLAAIAVLSGCAPVPMPEPLQLPPGVTRDQVVPPDGFAKDIRGMSPCSALTTEQVTDLGLIASSGRPNSTAEIPRCQWRSSGDRVTLFVAIPPGGLARLYQGHDSTPYRTFEPTTVEGYPAVRADQVAGSTDCTIFVGLAEDQSIWVTTGATVRALDDAICPTTKRAIAMILSNLPPLR